MWFIEESSAINFLSNQTHYFSLVDGGKRDCPARNCFVLVMFLVPWGILHAAVDSGSHGGVLYDASRMHRC